nr:ATP-binding cassette domain-containing protein [Klebsiella aerogenes]
MNDISLQVAAGEHIAILGRTGCGKSTLLQLLTRAWDPASGQIQLNAHPPRPVAKYRSAPVSTVADSGRLPRPG